MLKKIVPILFSILAIQTLHAQNYVFENLEPGSLKASLACLNTLTEAAQYIQVETTANSSITGETKNILLDSVKYDLKRSISNASAADKMIEVIENVRSPKTRMYQGEGFIFVPEGEYVEKSQKFGQAIEYHIYSFDNPWTPFTMYYYNKKEKHWKTNEKLMKISSASDLRSMFFQIRNRPFVKSNDPYTKKSMQNLVIFNFNPRDDVPCRCIFNSGQVYCDVIEIERSGIHQF